MKFNDSFQSLSIRKSKMAAQMRNFRLLVKQLKSPFSRSFGTRNNHNLLVRDINGVVIQHKNLFATIACMELRVLSSHLHGSDGSSGTRSYHVGRTLSIKASNLSKDKPLQKADVGCPICSANISFSYKDVLFLSQFLSPEGNLLSRRVTGVCGKQQIKLEKAIKISRRLGLLPKCGPVTTQEPSIS